MSGLTVADTNMLLRLLVGDVPEQADVAVRWLRRQQESSVLVIDAVLVEVLFLLESKRAYGIQRQKYTPEVLCLLRSTPWKVLPLTWQALAIFSESKLDYVDCVLAALYTGGIVEGVATFDKGLAKKVDGSSLHDIKDLEK